MCLLDERKRAIMQLRQGKKQQDVAAALGRSVGWVAKWQKRYEEEGWNGLRSRSRQPKQHGRQTPPEVKEAICRVRQELEYEAATGQTLKYVGGRAIRTRLKKEAVRPLPSIPTIERVLHEAGLTRSKRTTRPATVNYPRLQPTQPQQLLQVDIVPHHLTGGQRVFCFNSLDVVSRFPTGRAYERKRSQEAAEFLLHCWQEQGLPRYTQLDNEGCFSGGSTHPHVLGKVVRLGLRLGTELVFTPVRHPKSNGHIERFHQEYDRHVWEGTYLADLTMVNRQGEQFFAQYRQWPDHRQLAGHSPQQWHETQPLRTLPAGFSLPERLPLYEGCLHFIRRVEPGGTVSVLNVDWAVPGADPQRGVWVTLTLTCSGATLQIFDNGPDGGSRNLLVTHPFPLNEPVLPRPVAADPAQAPPEPDSALETEAVPPATATPLPKELIWITSDMARRGERLILSTLDFTAALTKRLFSTMY